jgi:hypothetical protein
LVNMSRGAVAVVCASAGSAKLAIIGAANIHVYRFIPCSLTNLARRQRPDFPTLGYSWFLSVCRL